MFLNLLSLKDLNLPPFFQTKMQSGTACLCSAIGQALNQTLQQMTKIPLVVSWSSAAMFGSRLVRLHCKDKLSQTAFLFEKMEASSSLSTKASSKTCRILFFLAHHDTKVKKMVV